MNQQQNLNFNHKNLISKVAKENGFKNFVISIYSGSKKSDNYVGIITSVKVTEKESNKTVDFILKHSKQEDAFRKDGQASTVFVREAKMYCEILPQMLRFQENAGITNPFLGVAKCYGVNLESNQECILMENIQSKGYKMWNRRIPIDHHHIILAFTEYAKFHAISLTMKHKDPQKFEELTKDLTSVMGSTDQRRKLFRSYRKTALKCLTNQELQDRFEEHWANVEKTYVELRNEKFVIQHGDAWCNNMLFKYKEEDPREPNHLYLIDWQNSKIGSPVWDLLYFLFVCASKKEFCNYKYYLTIYFKTLCQNLMEFGCDPDVVFSFQTLIDQWQKYAKMGLFCKLMVGQIIVAEECDIPSNIDELRKDKNKTLDEIINLSLERQDEYNKRLEDLMKFLLEEKLL